MHVRKTTKMVLCVLSALLMCSCATKTDLENVQNQAYRDRQESRKTVQRLEEDLSKSQEALRDEIQKSTSPVQARQANTWAELEALRVQVAKQQEKLDTLAMKFNAMTTSQAGAPTLAEVTHDVQNIKVALESQLGINLGSGATASGAEASTPAAEKGKAGGKIEVSKNSPKEHETGKADTADALFTKADAAFKAKKYEDARLYYSEFATTFKKHPNASSAIFWVGECAYNLQDYGKAVLAYQEVIEKHKNSNKYKSAILKQGMAFYKIGKDKAGKAVLLDLIERFPSAPESTRAKQFIKEHK